MDFAARLKYRAPKFHKILAKDRFINSANFTESCAKFIGLSCRISVKFHSLVLLKFL
ncbi:hypothetical protein [uncultured Campylobacter sp.]|uniref:hypothetical protein n=1 Tax=uncultured Campylobacter sp. TaxID=218934 RepID=UPI00262601D4|nr:hypothetical protein [uncultured Campylobacter sp.]